VDSGLLLWSERRLQAKDERPVRCCGSRRTTGKVSGTGRVRGRDGGSCWWRRSVGEDEYVSSRSTYMMLVSSSPPRTSSRS
jgi:hypothetical protein